MAIFNSYVSLPEGTCYLHQGTLNFGICLICFVQVKVLVQSGLTSPDHLPDLSGCCYTCGQAICLSCVAASLNWCALAIALRIVLCWPGQPISPSVPGLVNIDIIGFIVSGTFLFLFLGTCCA